MVGKGSVPLCACGCGHHVRWNVAKGRWGRFVNGHQFRGKKHTAASLMRMSESLKALSRPETKRELAERMSKKSRPHCECGCKGHVTWNEKKRCWNKFICGHNGRLNQGRNHTKGARRKIRRVKLGKRRSGETKKKISRTLLKSRKERSKVQLERWQDPEYQQKMQGKSGYKRSRNGYREDLGHYVRSSWEANFARLLSFLGTEYEYEPRRFMMKDASNELVASYLPDFYLVGLARYVELKGYWASGARRKVLLFQEAYPDIELDIIEELDYKRLEDKFSNLVPNWE